MPLLAGMPRRVRPIVGGARCMQANLKGYIVAVDRSSNVQRHPFGPFRRAVYKNWVHGDLGRSLVLTLSARLVGEGDNMAVWVEDVAHRVSPVAGLDRA